VFIFLPIDDQYIYSCLCSYITEKICIYCEVLMASMVAVSEDVVVENTNV